MNLLDPGSGLEQIGSGINIPDPQLWLSVHQRWELLIFCYISCQNTSDISVRRFLRNYIGVQIGYFMGVLLPENLHTYFELSAQAWTLYKAP